MHYTYILQSTKDGKYYTGCTNDIRKRLSEHNQNKVSSTKSRGPFDIVYYEACKDIQDAFVREKYLKSGQGKRYLKNRIKRFLFLTGQDLKINNKVHSVRSESSKTTKTSNGGFLALMSSIIISAILLFITINTSFNGFYTRFNILDTEIKERSFALADSCLDIALLRFAQNSSFTGNISNSVSEASCLIGPVTITTTQKIFKIKGVYSNAHTNLNVILNSTNHTVISVEEILTY